MKFYKLVEISEDEYLETTGNYDVLSGYYEQCTDPVDDAIYVAVNDATEEITITVSDFTNDNNDLDYEG